MKVSVIIPTFQGAKKILNTVSQLENQGFRDFEVIVVVDGSSDNTVVLLKSINCSFPLKIIEQSNKGRAATRNHGASSAKGEFLFFLDDDIILENNCIENHLAFQSNVDGGLVSGSQLEVETNITTDFQEYRAFLSKKWIAKLPQKKKLNRDELFLSASNFSIPKTIFNSLGGFDLRLTDAEDFELAVRAFSKGYFVYYLPEAIGFHDDKISLKLYINRLRQYKKAHMQMILVNPDAMEYFDIQKYQIKVFSLKGFFYYIFSLKAWISVIQANGLTFLPKMARYKIYDWVTTALYLYYPEKSLE